MEATPEIGHRGVTVYSTRKSRICNDFGSRRGCVRLDIDARPRRYVNGMGC
jgi:hypothetical protein